MTRFGRMLQRNLVVFLVLWSAVVIAVLAFIGVGAPGTRALMAVAGAVVVLAVGVYLIAPEAFESRAYRIAVIELLAAGTSIALAYRIVGALLVATSRPDHSYPLWAWIASALVLHAALLAVASLIVRSHDLITVRAAMAAFALTGLVLAVVMEATRIVDLGFTAGRWGLAPVGVMVALYPVLAVPFHIVTSAALGWGWARSAGGDGRVFLLGTFAGVVVVTGWFNYALTRDPFSAIAILLGTVGVWAWLHLRSAEGAPMVDAVPKRAAG